MESYVKKGKIENSTIILLAISLLVMVFGISLYLFRLISSTAPPPVLTALFCMVLVLLLLFIADKLFSDDRNRNSMKGQLLSLDDLNPNLDYRISWISNDGSVYRIELYNKTDESEESLYNLECLYYYNGREMCNVLLSYDFNFKAGLVFRKRQDGSTFFIAPETSPDERRKE